MKIENKDLILYLIEERTNFLLYQNNANPDVGFSLPPIFARRSAIESLKNECKIPAEYTD